MKNKSQGSMTIFATLTILLVSAFLLVLLEAGRQNHLRSIAYLKTQAAMESVFAGYCRPLWESYGILAFDYGGTEETEPFFEWENYVVGTCKEDESKSSGKEQSHLRLMVQEAEFDEYRLLTDDSGGVYIASASAYMKNTLAKQMIDALIEQYQLLVGLNVSDSPDASAIDAADAAIEEANDIAEATEEGNTKKGNTKKKAAANDKDIIATSQESVIELEESPLDIIKALWSKGVLTLVLEDANSVSKERESYKDAVTGRTLCEGTCSNEVENDWVDMLLFSQYLLEQFSCYTKGDATGTQQYELEYILCGKEKDSDNLCGAVERLLAVREAANLAYLAADAGKQQLAYSVAVSLAGITANAAIIYAVKCGVLAAWALAESILDVRALLAGEKIALLKNSTQWTSDILHLGEAFSSFGKAKGCSNGIPYERYLGFLIMLNEQRASYRAMDIQETAIRKQEGYEHFCMDHMVTDARLVVCYQTKPLFLGMDPLTKDMDSTFQILSQTSFSYRKAGE